MTSVDCVRLFCTKCNLISESPQLLLVSPEFAQRERLGCSHLSARRAAVSARPLSFSHATTQFGVSTMAQRLHSFGSQYTHIAVDAWHQSIKANVICDSGHAQKMPEITAAVVTIQERQTKAPRLAADDSLRCIMLPSRTAP